MHVHPPHAHDHGGRAHAHARRGVGGHLRELFVPHTHDAADSIDDALEASAAGIRALKISMLILLGTTLLQLALVVVTSSVALLADTIHNFADALTAVPLWIAFVLARRAASRRHTYGFGRAEDLAGLFIVVVIALSAVIAGAEAIDRLVHPHAVENPWLLVAAGLIGFAGNEIVAVYRIRVGARIGSAALVADGVHARLDGLTSLAVVLGAAGVLLGMPVADPLIGLLISLSILVLLGGTVRSVGARLMDAIDPALGDRARHALSHVAGIGGIEQVRLRWVGHRLHGDAVIHVGDVSLAEASRIAATAEAALRRELPTLDDVAVRTLARP